VMLGRLECNKPFNNKPIILKVDKKKKQTWRKSKQVIKINNQDPVETYCLFDKI
jgi:hypothetical protein